MAAGGGTRRRFDPRRDAQRFVFLLDEDEGRLFEVIGVRGVRRGEVRADAAVKLLDVRRDLPADPFAALDAGVWVPVEEALVLAVVERGVEDGRSDGS